MDSHETANKIVLRDKSGNTFEIPKTQGECILDNIEILTQSGKESLKGGEGGFPWLIKGNYEEKSGIINSVKASYKCPEHKDSVLEFDKSERKLSGCKK